MARGIGFAALLAGVVRAPQACPAAGLPLRAFKACPSLPALLLPVRQRFAF